MFSYLESQRKVALVFLLITSDIFHNFSQCFYYWLLVSICFLGWCYGKKQVQHKSILRLYTTVTSWKKSQESSMHWFFTNLEKPNFGPFLNSFWPWNLKKIIAVYLTSIYYLTSCKKLDKFQALIFYNTWHISFWINFGFFLAKKPKNKISRIKIVQVNF